MKSRWKKYLAAGLLTAGVLSLTGCHGAKEEKSFELPDTFDTSKNYELTFWAKNDTNKTQTDIYKKAISDFESLYPNITVNLKLYTDYGKIYNDVITNIATDTTPNVCITYPDHIATYLTGKDTVVPLDELLTALAEAVWLSTLRRRRRSFRSSFPSAASRAIIMPCPSCVPPRPAM